MESMRKGSCSCFDSGLYIDDTTSQNLPPKQRKRRSCAGFTLTEVIVVITIIGILAAIAVPSMIGFIEHGEQVNRTNIARTLYLAAQNQLTKSNLEKNLKATLTGLYFQEDSGPYTDLPIDSEKDTRNVALALGSNFPGEESANAGYVHYISKPKGYTPPIDDEIEAMSEAEKAEAIEIRGFYYLLDEIIIDKSILNEAILIEYNIMTGVVLSVFYGDMLDEGKEFNYDGNPDDNIYSNVVGGRGVDNGYMKASDRKQGYYGVESTGEVSLPNFKDIVNIYDGVDKPLDTGLGGKKVNVLYVELLLAKKYKADGTEDEMPAYTFEIVNSNSLYGVISISVDNLDKSGFPTSFDSAFNNLSSSDAIYRDTINPVVVEQYGINVSGYYNRYIWVIDYIEGNTLSGQPHSIGVKYKDGEGRLIEPQSVRAKALKSGGVEVMSLSLANTHFNGELSGGRYEIKSARHLNNIRYIPNGKFRQTADIDMQLDSNAVTNFAPIEDFSGEYYAMKTSNTQYRIINLKINSSQSNVGLFANISGSNSSVQGVSLYKAIINATNSDNVGAITGIMDGGTIKQCNSYANITVSSNISTNVGGLAGQISNGSLDQSFNAGFYNAPDKSATSEGFGSVTANRGNIGGLVGLNDSTIQNCYNNARVNINNVSVTRDGEMLSYDPIFTQFSAAGSVGGIAGYNNGGTIKNTYAINFVSLATDFTSSYGGISGTNTGGYNLENNFYLANGCTGSTGSEAVSKEKLRENPCGSLFAQNYAAGYDNLYINYPYPTLRNNNPFADSNYACGWENIEDAKAGDTGLLYYELYDDETTGFSGGSFESLVLSGTSKLVVNDGYVLDIGFTSSKMTVKIGTKTYWLTVTESPAPGYIWKDAADNVITAVTDSMVGYTDTDENQRYLLFFKNSFLEDHADGEAYIDFEVKVLNETIISTKFNPLFANTVGRTTNNFTVRSPRHFDNINKALSTNYSQGLDLDFTVYRKEAAYTYQSSDGTVRGIAEGDELSYADNTAVVSGSFAGDYNGNDFYVKVTKADKGLFAVIGSAGAVRKLVLKDSAIGQGNNVGGIASVNNGTIDSCLVSKVTINGASDIGIVTGINNGSIVDTRVESCIIASTNDNRQGGIAGTNTKNITNCKVDNNTVIGGFQIVGGIAGNNTGAITGCLVASAKISGSYDSVGGIAGANSASVTGCTVTSVTVKNTVSGKKIGGIAGENTGTGAISSCSVTSSEISGSDDNVGGIAGENSASVTGCTVTSVTVKNTVSGNKIGGIAGNNTGTGTISSCLAVSSAVSGIHSNVGGVAGDNTGSVLKSGASNTTVKSLSGNNVGGVVGSNNSYGTVEDVFFLSTNDLGAVPVSAAVSETWDGIAGGIVGNNAGNVSRAFYFAPAPSRIVGNVTTIYPIIGTGNAAMKNNTGNETCFYLAGYRYSLNEGINWTSTDYNRIHTADDAGLSVNLSGGGMGLVTKFIAKDWLEFAYDSDLTNWYQPTNGYPYPMPAGISVPNKWPQTDSPTRPEQLDRANSDWAGTESTSDRGRNVTFINGDFSNTLDQSYIPTGSNMLVDGGTSGYRRAYINMEGVPGWSTRPVSNSNPGSSSNIQNNNYWIELQEPIGTSSINSGYYNNYMASNYKGGYNTTLNVLTSQYKYAELNADVQGTLYQLCTTTPGAQFYYSFYHASRGATTDKMNFYLTGVGDNDAYANDSDLVLIRPCWSPRTLIDSSYSTTTKLSGNNWGKYSTYWNPAVRNTVKYDNLGNVGGTAVSLTVGSLSYYADKFNNWPTNNNQQIYLYDVWIGTTTTGNVQNVSGYGVTFWSTSNRTLATTGYATLDNLISAAPEAATNVIGYWGISYGWKHYYGLYEVPQGQTRTEFAYQSRTNSATNGNYLDGISFKSPAFLSIDKYIKDKSGEDVKFVTLDDVLTVELHVTSYGEIAADNIKITDTLAPYDAYIDYIGNVTVKRGAATIDGSTVSVPNDGNSQTLTITLPAATTLTTGETLTVTFQIKVRQQVKGVSLETLLFYFKNQAEVSYNEDKQANTNGFNGYINNVKANASETLQVYIDPIKLSKAVTPDKDGPFTVTLTVEDTLGAGSTITTKGLITDLIPEGFSVVKAPSDAVLTLNADGSTRIAIQNVNLQGTVKKLEYTYTLEYTGAGYGVAYTSVSADYKYQYIDENYSLSVMLDFPKQVVGISIKTQDDVFMVDDGTGSELLNITTNDNFAKVLADANYDVTPEVVLLRDSEGNAASINGAGNYQIDTPQYTAVLIKGSNRLEFTPKAGAAGNYVLYYQIKLNATKTGNASFALSSRETTVTVNVVGNTLVYYEKYGDDTYGFYAVSGSVSQGLDDTKLIIENGYGVLSAASGRSVQLGDGEVSSLSENYNGMYLYKFGTVPITNLNLLTVKFGKTGSMSDIGMIHPNFAKAVYAAEAGNADDPFYIRTPQQMRNIGLVDAAGKTFIQERNLDFDSIDLNSDGAVVKGIFKGTFDGGVFVITNVRIDAAAIDNVGLFRQNSGTIRNVTLKPDTNIKGKSNVGGITGYNQNGGLIERCIVEGKEDAGNPGSYSGMHIEGTVNVGGIAGSNDGVINDCTVRNTTQTVKGNDYVGGIAGLNGTTGMITGALVENVRLETDGIHVGAFCGDNLNKDEDSVSGEANNVIGLITELDDTISSGDAGSSDDTSVSDNDTDSEESVNITTLSLTADTFLLTVLPDDVLGKNEIIKKGGGRYAKGK